MSYAIKEKEEKIRVLEWDINYVKVGHGPIKLLCISGNLTDLWFAYKPLLRAVDRQKFTVVALDLPGFGKSEPLLERGFSRDFYEENADFGYELMMALGIKKFSILGYCTGGRAAIILAAKYPQAVGKLIVLSSNTFTLPHELELAGFNSPKTWRTEAIQSHKQYDLDELDRYWTQYVAEFRAAAAASGGEICSHWLKDVRCPTLIVHAEDDDFVDSSHASFLHSRIVGSRLHMYPDGKHSIHAVHENDFNERVQAFLLE